MEGGFYFAYSQANKEKIILDYEKKASVFKQF
jgi:hypothetical protein